MRLFEERVGISTSYIHGIEKESLLPSPEKLQLLASVFVEVAQEQEAGDPEADARRLFRERERSAYIDQLGFEPKLAGVLVSLGELGSKARADIIEPLREAIGLFDTLDSQERKAVKKLLNKLVTFLESLEGSDRTHAAVFLADAAEEALESFDAEDLGDFKPPEPDQPATKLETSS